MTPPPVVPGPDRRFIVVTSPTGKIGSLVSRTLLSKGHALRVVARDPARLAPEVRAGADVVVGSHRDAGVIDRALIGARAMLWIMPADRSADDAVSAYLGVSRAGVNAVVQHRVSHVVGVSALGRTRPQAPNAGNVTGSLAMDEAFGAVTNYRALANATFTDNLLREAGTILSDGVVTGALPHDKAAPMVATRDIAATAVNLLSDPSWSGFADIAQLGPESVTGDEVASIVGGVLGRSVQYRQVAPASLEQAMLSYGTSPAMARAMADMAQAKVDGLDDDYVANPAHPTPTSVRDWCIDVLAPAVRQLAQVAD